VAAAEDPHRRCSHPVNTEEEPGGAELTLVDVGPGEGEEGFQPDAEEEGDPPQRQ